MILSNYLFNTPASLHLAPHDEEIVSLIDKLSKVSFPEVTFVSGQRAEISNRVTPIMSEEQNQGEELKVHLSTDEDEEDLHQMVPKNKISALPGLNQDSNQDLKRFKPGFDSQFRIQNQALHLSPSITIISTCCTCI